MIAPKHIWIARTFLLSLSSRPSTNRQVLILLAAIAALCLAPTMSLAAPIALSPNSVIGGSGSLNDDGSRWDGTADGGLFAGSHITDGSKSENENGRQYWLVNTDGPGGEPGYLVIDLGDTYDIDQIDLYNTHNRGSHNFSTKNFRIDASNSVVDTGSSADFDLSGNIATILTGTLSETTGEDPISTADSFTSSITPHPEVYVRYLRFNSLGGFTHSADGPPEVHYKDNQRGLNEIEVSGTQGAPIPEPSTLVLGLLGLLGFLRRRN